MSQNKEKTRIRAGAVIFWCFYLLLIAAFCVGLHHGLRFLEGWLIDYQASQPDVKSEQVFQEKFAQPDWAALYAAAGHTDTLYETAEYYAAYMEAKVGSTPLSYYETSAGLSNDRKYIVRAGEEKVATFVLTDMAQDASEIRDWQYASVEVFYTRQQSAQICTQQGCTVYINGTALTDAHIIQTLHTDAEKYLPEDEDGLQRQWLYVDGLLVAPQVTALNAAGEPVELAYDKTANMYTQVFEEMVISQEERDAVVEAAKVYCRYMIGANASNTLSTYFDRNMDNYSAILYGDNWMQDYDSYDFSEAALTGFYRYSDSRFSVRLTMSLNVKRNDGSIKEYPLDTTFFLEKQEEENWLVYHMTNVDVQKQTTLVRMRYMVDGEILADQMAENTAVSLTPPAVTAPEGKVFSGWYQLQTDESGNATYSLAFLPGEDGTVSFSGETALEPMILYALFENEEA